METSLIGSFPLERYGYNLTYLAHQGVFSPLVGYETCVSRVFEILIRREKTNHKYNPLLLDLDGMQRWQVLTEVIRRMAIGEAPDPLPSQQVISLNAEALLTDPLDSTAADVIGGIAGTQSGEKLWHGVPVELASKEKGGLWFPGEVWPSLEKWSAPPEVMRSRFQAFFLAARQSAGRVVLFINDLHRLVGGEWQRYPIDEAPLLKPLLARQEIQLIGACTPVQYQQSIERDAALSRRIQEIYLRPDEDLQRN